MKKFIHLLILTSIYFLYACQKGEIPGNDQKYVGTWRNIGGTIDNSYVVTIGEDAKASYVENTSNGVSYSNKSVSGYIYFKDDYNFRIGSKRVGKKFKADQAPKRVTITVTPYKYYYIATFNGIDYKKD